MFFKRKSKSICPVHSCELREENLVIASGELGRRFGEQGRRTKIEDARDPVDVGSITETVLICPVCEEAERRAAEGEKQKKQQEREKKEAQEAAYHCPGCGKLLDSRKHSFCPNCGDSRSCECGRVWQKGEKFCPSCGAER